MKRHWFIILFLVLVGSYFTSVRYIKNENLSVDMVEINDKYMKIKAALEERDIIEENVSDLEEQYHCDILLSNNLQYDEKVAGAIKENKVIIDLTINNETMILNVEEYIELDCELLIAHKSYESADDKLKVIFFKLIPGLNRIDILGIYTKLEIIYRKAYL